MKHLKVTAISITAPKGAEANPVLTPELQASVLAKFSRSNEGLDQILSKVDLQNPEESIARILKFVDYGHASIGGLTGGIGVVLDNITMFLAFKLFELSPMSDGQESSTRYITMTPESLPDWQALGFNESQTKILDDWARCGLATYDEAYNKLDTVASANPDVVRVPVKLRDKPKAIERLRKNYALDRARYFLPFALKTNAGLIQSARMWCETLSGLYSLDIPEATEVADAIKAALMPYAPNLLRHARAKPGWREYQRLDMAATVQTNNHNYGVNVDVLPSPYATDELIADALKARENRYDHCGIAARDSVVRVLWKGCMAIAEIRDLNRHRTGTRFTPLDHRGFYLPEETRKLVDRRSLALWEDKMGEVIRMVHRDNLVALRPYTLALGSETSYSHTTTLEKFVYMAELRTGAGAHFKYAQDVLNAVAKLAETYPLTAAAIQTGEYLPE